MSCRCKGKDPKCGSGLAGHCPGACDESAGPGACGGGPGNQPVDIHCTLARSIQGAVDSAKRMQHVLGLRPYRVYIVWERRSTRQRFEEIKKIELMPVKVETVTSSYTTPVGLELAPIGLHAEGGIRLKEVSPLQVSENDLRGKLDNRDLTTDERYFYELVHTPWCAGDSPPRTQRFVLNGLPYHNGDNFCWEVELTDSEAPREPEGTWPDRDATHVPEIVRRKDVLRG